MFGSTNNRQQRTEEIIAIKKSFGDIYNIESTAGFLNVIQTERKQVREMIFSMSLEEAIDYMFKLDAQLLPSKEKNIQCLMGIENCIKPSMSCKNCSMSIPNFYALSSLGNSLISRIQEIKKFHDKGALIEKKKITNLYYFEMDQWKRAIEIFGKDNAYKFIEGGSDTLKKEMKEIPVSKILEYKK